MVIKQRNDPEADTEGFGAMSPRVAVRHWRLVESDEVDEDQPLAEIDSNELLDGGTTCAHCGEVIESGQPVRRTAAGELRHEVCLHEK